MSPPISNLTNNVPSVNTTQSEVPTSGVKGHKPHGATTRSDLNAQIIEASLKVSLGTSNNSQGLLFRSSLEAIYESLFGKFESNIMPDYKMPTITDTDNPFATPEGSANVILSFSLGMYEIYAAQHKGKDEAEIAANFINVIRGGFEKGYNEAVDILKGMKAFDGHVKSEIEKTWDLVQKGYDEWLAAKLDTNPAEVDT